MSHAEANRILNIEDEAHCAHGSTKPAGLLLHGHRAIQVWLTGDSLRERWKDTVCAPVTCRGPFETEVPTGHVK